ncbi:MAG: N-acetyltransferase [Caulobacteraceae bacterium]|nr:N-acetyltransferase [Caulobacteraceae bacterium]
MIVDYQNQEYIKKWAGAIIGVADFGLSTAIGIMEGNKLICAVIYNNFMMSPEGNPVSIEMSVASVDKRWCNRHNLGVFFRYPFVQLGVRRVQATIAKKNKPVRKFCQKLGFKYEGTGRKAWPLGGDACVYSMLKPECKWI